MRRSLSVAGILVLAIAVGALAQSAPPSNQGPVSREEYEKLKQQQEQTSQELEALKKSVAEQKAEVPAPAEAAPRESSPSTQPAPSAEDYDYLQKEVDALTDELARFRSGTSTLLIAGDMATGFTTQRGTKSTFDAGIAPLILYQPTDRILVEAGADIGVSTDDSNSSDTSFDLTIANVSYLVNDNLAIGAGLFVVPFGVYHNHFDPPWIDKFPDDPLAFSDGGIAPSSEVGIFARGAVPVRSMKFTYDAYVTNGPNLYVNNDNGNAGSLNFDDFTDLNDNKAVGGRIGFLPFPNIEMGYSVQYSEPSPSGFKNVSAFLQAVDLNWRQEIPYGMLDFRTEWVTSNVSDATYDPTGSMGFGPVSFTNYRQGGYVQLCFRPTKADNKIVRNLEFCSRYDWLIQPLNAPGGDHEKRLTLGVDYWVTPAVVLKAAYEIDDKKVGENQNAFLLQVGMGL